MLDVVLMYTTSDREFLVARYAKIAKFRDTSDRPTRLKIRRMYDSDSRVWVVYGVSAGEFIYHRASSYETARRIAEAVIR